MPELPEVQTIVNDLNKKVAGKKIVGVWYNWAKTIKRPRADKLESEINGMEIQRVDRRGKNILIYLQSPKSKILNSNLLLVHLKMTGHLLIGKWKVKNEKCESLVKGPLREKVNDYIHVIFYLSNGYELALSDLRKFAKIIFGSRAEVEKAGGLYKIGPEPLDPKFKFKQFSEIISKQRRKIKQVLMDPAVIAGIGNIYSDDILWSAKISPLRPANSLTVDELKTLYKEVKNILKKALKLRGTSISDFRDTAGKSGFYAGKRLVYRREGKPCKRCGTKIKRVKVGGRSAHYCPVCQRA